MGQRKTEQDSSNPQVFRVAVPSREAVITVQMNNLLRAADMLLGFAANTRKEDFDSPPRACPEIDGGLKTQADITTVAVLDRIERLAKDDKSWGTEQQQEMHKAAMDMYRRNTELLQLSAMAAEMATRPHVRLQPRLLRHPEGGWMAVLGDLTDGNNLIVGMGASPEDAVFDFDLKFRAADAALLERLKPQAEQRAADLKSGVTNPTPAIIEAEVLPEPKPRKKGSSK